MIVNDYGYLVCILSLVGLIGVNGLVGKRNLIFCNCKNVLEF